MQLITAVIKPHALDAVKDALKAIDRVPHVPHTPCTEMAPTGSSTPRRSKNRTE